MKNKFEFKGMKLDNIVKHPSLNIFGATGFRSSLIFDTELNVLQRHIDSNKSEKFYCSAFMDIPESLHIVKSNEKIMRNNLKNDQKLIKKSIQNEENYVKSNSGDDNKKSHEYERSIQNEENYAKSSSGDDDNKKSHECESNLENFYVNIKRLFCIAGELGIIKILNVEKCEFEGYLKGHTDVIYDMKTYKYILITCSGDGSIRFWDIRKYKCIGVIGGLTGHKDHILTIDYDEKHGLLVSSGTDLTIRQWKVDLNDMCAGDVEKHIYENFTLFKNIHNSSIKKVMYYGDLILSLSNRTITVVYNNIELDKKIEALHRENVSEKKTDFNGYFDLDRNSEIIVKIIRFPHFCINFKIFHQHILIGMSRNGTIYIYNLKYLKSESALHIIESNLIDIEDFEVFNNEIYIITGNSIHKMDLNLSIF